MANLGSAGCRFGDGHFCSFLETNLFEYKCKKYHVCMEKHWSGDPYRADICCGEANKESWSKIITAKNMG